MADSVADTRSLPRHTEAAEKKCLEFDTRSLSDRPTQRPLFVLDDKITSKSYERSGHTFRLDYKTFCPRAGQRDAAVHCRLGMRAVSIFDVFDVRASGSRLYVYTSIQLFKRVFFSHLFVVISSFSPHLMHVLFLGSSGAEGKHSPPPPANRLPPGGFTYAAFILPSRPLRILRILVSPGCLGFLYRTRLEPSGIVACRDVAVHFATELATICDCTDYF